MDSQAASRDASAMAHRILLLGGTFEARALAGELARRDDLAVTLSLAGRTKSPVQMPVPVRIGGFGGAEGLVAWLRGKNIAVLVDATHPYAAQISANAAMAARMAGLPLLALRRAAWRAEPGDDWREVADIPAALEAIGPPPRRIFLALGRQEVAGFAAAPQHRYVIRSVDPILPRLPLADVTYLTARGPFAVEAEQALLGEHRIEAIICKNSGGMASHGKIVAARALGLPVVMLARPALPEVPYCATVAEALTWLDHALRLRGV